MPEKLRNLQGQDGAVALVLAVYSRGMPDTSALVPSSAKFGTQGQAFVTDAMSAPPGGYCAVVRGHNDCFPEGDTLEELKEPSNQVAV